ncbi:TPA: permease [Pasteurella multocida]|nr:permease [Pasteurella multocida]
MSLSILSPLLYLFIGMFLARFPLNIKGKISIFLTKCVIPAVIVYNIATYKKGFLVIMLGTMLMLLILFLISRVYQENPVKRLCFFYLNIAWFGLPIGNAIWGSDAAMILISVYIGSSLFCNSACVSLMSSGTTWKKQLSQLATSPPVLALMLGIVTMPVGEWIERQCVFLYESLKFTMTFLGMMLLGMWLASTKLKQADFKEAMVLFVFRMLTIALLVSVFLHLADFYEFELIIQNKPVFYLLSFLPPAANLIILETYYLNTGTSASRIACGTIISLMAISIYVTGLLIFSSPI